MEKLRKFLLSAVKELLQLVWKFILVAFIVVAVNLSYVALAAYTNTEMPPGWAKMTVIAWIIYQFILRERGSQNNLSEEQNQVP